MNLHGLSFRVTSTAAQGVVSSETQLDLTQVGPRIFGRYGGGSIRRGCLVGTLDGTTLRFRYAQTERSGHVHGGRSVCELERLADGRLRLTERFTWETRAGTGVNIFEQRAGAS